MCMVDDSDGRVIVLSAGDPTARKEHRCRECRRTIRAGERYHVERFLWDGTIETHKTCQHCMVAREWLAGECGGWLYGEVEEDIRSHATSGYYGRDVMRLAVGMRRYWTRRDGSLMAVPMCPEVTP